MFGGVLARLKSNLVALLSPLATQQLFSHITYTPCVPYALFTDLRVSTPIIQPFSITARVFSFFCCCFVCCPIFPSDFLFLSPRSQNVRLASSINIILGEKSTSLLTLSAAAANCALKLTWAKHWGQILKWYGGKFVTPQWPPPATHKLPAPASLALDYA